MLRSSSTGCGEEISGSYAKRTGSAASMQSTRGTNASPSSIGSRGQKWELSYASWEETTRYFIVVFVEHIPDKSVELMVVQYPEEWVMGTGRDIVDCWNDDIGVGCKIFRQIVGIFDTLTLCTIWSSSEFRVLKVNYQRSVFRVSQSTFKCNSEGRVV